MPVKTFADFPKIIFHVDDVGSWRYYYSVATFVQACMGGYATGLVVLTREGLPNLDLSELANEIAAQNQQHRENFFSTQEFNQGAIAALKAYEQDFKKRQTAVVEAYIANH